MDSLDNTFWLFVALWAVVMYLAVVLPDKFMKWLHRRAANRRLRMIKWPQ